MREKNNRGESGNVCVCETLSLCVCICVCLTVRICVFKCVSVGESVFMCTRVSICAMCEVCWPSGDKAAPEPLKLLRRDRESGQPVQDQAPGALCDTLTAPEL